MLTEANSSGMADLVAPMPLSISSGIFLGSIYQNCCYSLIKWKLVCFCCFFPSATKQINFGNNNQNSGLNSSTSELKKAKQHIEADLDDLVQRQKTNDDGMGITTNLDDNLFERNSKQIMVRKTSGNSSIPLRRNISTSAAGHQDLDGLKTAYGRLKAVTVPNTRVQDLHEPFGPHKSVKGTNTASLHCDLETTAFSLDAALDTSSVMGTAGHNVGNTVAVSLVNNTHRTLSGANIGKCNL